jgi:hypothetical protein
MPCGARRTPEHQGAERVRTRHRTPLLHTLRTLRPAGPPRPFRVVRGTPRSATRITLRIAIGNMLRFAPPCPSRAGRGERRGPLGGLQLRPGPGGSSLVRQLARRRGRYGAGPRGRDGGLCDPAAPVRAGGGAPGRRAAEHVAPTPTRPAAARTAREDRHGEHGSHGDHGVRERSGTEGRPMGRKRHGSSPRRSSHWGKQVGRLTGLRVHLRFFSANFRQWHIPCSNDPPTPVRPAPKGVRRPRAPYVDWPLPRGALPCGAHECNAS